MRSESVIERTALLNHLIEKNHYMDYLEIGVQKSNNNFNKVIAPHKEGVDPNVDCTYRMTSDAFFRMLPKEKKYDIIFIDGLHFESNTSRDIQNSLQHLRAAGCIVLHDCNPTARKYQRERPGPKGIWLGTVWKAIAKLRMTSKNLFICVVDCDWGCGFIKRGSQELFSIPHKQKKLKYRVLKKFRKELLNLISYEEFLKMNI
jgi:hypothetical protein